MRPSESKLPLYFQMCHIFLILSFSDKTQSIFEAYIESNTSNSRDETDSVYKPSVQRIQQKKIRIFLIFIDKILPLELMS